MRDISFGRRAAGLTLVLAASAVAFGTSQPASAGGSLTFLEQWKAGPDVGPVDVAVSDNGKVYVLIGGAKPRVRKFSPNGGLLDKWGGVPSALAIDVAPDGRVWVASHDGVLRVFTGGGALVDQWNPSHTGAINDISVTGVKRVFLVDASDSSVDRYKTTGMFFTEWFGDGSENFVNAAGVAVDAAGHVFVSDNHRVSKFHKDGEFIDSVGGDIPTASLGAFNSPARMDIRAHRLYVTEILNHRVQRFSTVDLDFVASVGGPTPGSDPGEFNEVRGVAADPVTGKVFATSLYDRRVEKFSP